MNDYSIISFIFSILNLYHFYNLMACICIYFLKFIYFIYLFLAVLGLRCCAQSFSGCSKWGPLFVAVCIFSLRWFLLLWSTGSRRAGSVVVARGLQQLWLTGSRAQAQQSWCTGLVAPRLGGSSCTRAQTRVPCIGRRFLNHCATREAPACIF